MWTLVGGSRSGFTEGTLVFAGVGGWGEGRGGGECLRGGWIVSLQVGLWNWTLWAESLLLFPFNTCPGWWLQNGGRGGGKACPSLEGGSWCAFPLSITIPSRLQAPGHRTAKPPPTLTSALTVPTPCHLRKWLPLCLSFPHGRSPTAFRDSGSGAHRQARRRRRRPFFQSPPSDILYIFSDQLQKILFLRSCNLNNI